LLKYMTWKKQLICDCIRYRNKIGIDIVKEALNEYIKKKEKNINKLIEYAKITGAYSITKKYFEVLL